MILVDARLGTSELPNCCNCRSEVCGPLEKCNCNVSVDPFHRLTRGYGYGHGSILSKDISNRKIFVMIVHVHRFSTTLSRVGKRATIYRIKQSSTIWPSHRIIFYSHQRIFFVWVGLRYRIAINLITSIAINS